MKGALIISEKGHLLEIKKSIYKNEKWTLFTNENGKLSKEKGHQSK